MQMGSMDRRSFSSNSDSKLAQVLDVEGKLSEDLDVKLKVDTVENEKLPQQEDKKEDGEEVEVEEEEEDEEEEEEEEEFSFACTNPDGSPASADVIFQNGLIRPVFPLFGQELIFSGGEESSQKAGSTALLPPLGKLFVEERDDRGSSSFSDSNEPEGPYCVWTEKDVEESPEVCKKSNSTGFSKLWRFRGQVPRSSSDGKDLFVFLTNPKSSKKAEKNSEKIAIEKEKEKKKKKKSKTGGATAAVASPHEKHYVANRKMKEGGKWKSYLPYRQDIVGVFTNINGMSRNIHPF